MCIDDFNGIAIIRCLDFCCILTHSILRNGVRYLIASIENNNVLKDMLPAIVIDFFCRYSRRSVSQLYSDLIGADIILVVFIIPSNRNSDGLNGFVCVNDRNRTSLVVGNGCLIPLYTLLCKSINDLLSLAVLRQVRECSSPSILGYSLLIS